MATSLPPGVWVRVDEVRNDMMCVRGVLFARFLLLVHGAGIEC